jgi:hypothetical protein
VRTFNTTQYEFAHGKRPRGHGYWAFVPADYVWPKEMPDGAVEFVYGNYGEAKKELAGKYPEITDWTVMS